MESIVCYLKRQPIIRSHHNTKLKTLKNLIRSARQQKFANFSILEGIHMAETAIEANIAVTQWVISEKALSDKKFFHLFEQTKFFQEIELNHLERTLILDEKLFSSISDLKSPEGILGIFHPRLSELSCALKETVIILDSLQDPGNVGSILRIAVAAGVKHVIAMRGNVLLWSPKVLRAGMGAHFHLYLYEKFSFDAVVRFVKVPFIVTVSSNKKYLGQYPSSIFASRLNGEAAWIFGNEGSGVTLRWKNYVDHLLTIPQSSSIESLNVAASVAICLFEQKRQKLQNEKNAQ